MLGINLNIPRKSCLRTQEFLTLISLKTLLDKYKQHLQLCVEYMLSRHVYSPNKAVNLPPAQLLRLPKLICSHTFPFAPCVPIRSIHATNSPPAPSSECIEYYSNFYFFPVNHLRLKVSEKTWELFIQYQQ